MIHDTDPGIFAIGLAVGVAIGWIQIGLGWLLRRNNNRGW